MSGAARIGGGVVALAISGAALGVWLGGTVSADVVPPPPDEVRCGSGFGLGCFVRLPAGTFLIGAQSDDPEALGYDVAARAEEGPVRRVAFPPLWFQQHEVIAADYAACVAEDWCTEDELAMREAIGTYRAAGRDSLAMAGVTHAGAATYCAFIGARLPTSDEWERAARGGDGRRFPWGDAVVCPYFRSKDDLDEKYREAGIDEACGPVEAVLGPGIDPERKDAIGDGLVALGGDVVIDLCERAPLDAAPDALASYLEAAIAAGASAASAVPLEPLDDCVADGVVHEAHLRRGHPQDMLGLAGNVAEWTDTPDPRDPSRRIVRGGSFVDDDPAAWRTTSIASLPADLPADDVGFRCVWDGGRDPTGP